MILSEEEQANERARLACTLILRNTIIKQLRRRGIEGDLNTAVERDGVIWAKVGGEKDEIEIEMTNGIQALWHASKKGAR